MRTAKNTLESLGILRTHYTSKNPQNAFVQQYKFKKKGLITF